MAAKKTFEENMARLEEIVGKLEKGDAPLSDSLKLFEELIPEMSQGRHSNLGTVFFAVGFSVMMVLDVALS